MDLHDRLVDFFALGNVAQGAKTVLATYLRQRPDPLPPDQQAQVSLTLSHLDAVREGFQLTLRTSSVTSLSELHDLVNRFLFDWGWLAEQGLQLLPENQIYLVQNQALAFAHAYTALAVMPRLPSHQITFPGYPTYADIPVPRRPGEVLERIDELEDVFWDATQMPEHEIDPEPLRRTYGFFETSAWLVFNHLKLFLR